MVKRVRFPASRSAALTPCPLQASDPASEHVWKDGFMEELLSAVTRGRKWASRPLSATRVLGQRGSQLGISWRALGEVRERNLSDGIRNGWILVLEDFGFTGPYGSHLWDPVRWCCDWDTGPCHLHVLPQTQLPPCDESQSDDDPGPWTTRM